MTDSSRTSPASIMLKKAHYDRVSSFSPWERLNSFRKIALLSAFIFYLSSNADCSQSEKVSRGVRGMMHTPPRGWNSYDSFSWLVTETEFMDNARFVSEHLLKHGYEYVVVDFLWYRKNENGATVLGGEDIVDEWGRPQPDPNRWPSSVGGRGFTDVAEKVHSLGLKFGIHVMRGISLAAVSQNSPILGAEGWKVTDVALLDEKCDWMPNSFVGVDASSAAGRSFISSIYEQYAAWGVDFVKHDCVFGTDLQLEEIKAVSDAISSIGRPMHYSLSPGVGSTTELGKQISQYVNTYRVTGDTWDDWDQVKSHFDVARDFVKAGLSGAPGLQGLAWPDLDMLPLGWLTDPGSQEGPHRYCRLTRDEQQTVMTLWAIAKSPIFYGGDLRNMDDTTYNLMTNDIVLDINANSQNNMQLATSEVSAESDLEARVWVAQRSSGETYIAIFNVGQLSISSIQVPMVKVMGALGHGTQSQQQQWQCIGKNIWTNENLQTVDGSLIYHILHAHSSFMCSLNCSIASWS